MAFDQFFSDYVVVIDMEIMESLFNCLLLCILVDMDESSCNRIFLK